MAPRNRTRPKAEQIPDAEILGIIEAHHPRIGQVRSPSPIEALAGRFPEKVVLAKLEKLAHRGFIERVGDLEEANLTQSGRDYLRRAREAA